MILDFFIILSYNVCVEYCQYIDRGNNVFGKKVIKICEYCGKEFETTSGTKKFCDGPHYRKCAVCGKEFQIPNEQINSKEPKMCCSRKCSRELTIRTNIARYGSASPASNKEVQAKMKATTLERYGVEHAAQSEQFKEKAKQTNLARYGVEYHTQSESAKKHLKELWNDLEFAQKMVQAKEDAVFAKYGVKSTLEIPEVYEKSRQTYEKRTGHRYTWEDPEGFAKMKQTTKERYGDEFVLRTDEFKKKAEQTSIERYGTANPMQSQYVKFKAIETNRERYGVDNAFQSPEIQAKMKATMQERYGVTNSSYIRKNLMNLMTDSSKVDNLEKFHSDPEGYVNSTFNSLPSMSQLANSIGIRSSTLGQFLSSHDLKHLVKFVRSEMEQSVVDLLNSLGETELSIDDRIAIKPLELDIYLPQYKFAIECNPTATHNSSVLDPWGSEVKSPSYHKKKTDLCEENGIFLFHIFGYEWTHKRPIIESMIRNILSKNENVIYARKCVVKEVPAAESYQFLEDNHRQGGAQSSIRLGLYHNDHLVSLMTFGKMRNSIGTGKENLENTYELVRFCSVLNTSVVGAASKLFKHFIKEYQPEAIRSFSDRAHTRGKLYQNLSFKEVRRSDAGYVWVNVVTDVAYHRVNAQKKNLKAFLKDDSVDLTKTEKQIMEEYGFVQVFDSGTITWEWRAENN